MCRAGLIDATPLCAAGLGAVHKSPEVHGARLLLTIDDIMDGRECACGKPHIGD